MERGDHLVASFTKLRCVTRTASPYRLPQVEPALVPQLGGGAELAVEEQAVKPTREAAVARRTMSFFMVERIRYSKVTIIPDLFLIFSRGCNLLPLLGNFFQFFR